MLDQLITAFRDYVSMRPEPEFKAWFADLDWSTVEAMPEANPLAPIRHLEPALLHAGEQEAKLVAALALLGAVLPWRQMYDSEDFGSFFTDNYAHVQLIGPEGMIHNDRIAAGLVIYGPGIDYPDHWHEATEIYVPLTGNGYWSKDGEPLDLRAAGSFIYHTSNMRHAIKATDSPLVALWVWTGGDLGQKAGY